ncbi:HAD family hydrolase [Phenylobacterium deserti]|uniref:HAD family hydrolase n=1 Tax=Phenylobacterium deserti TaxID=1914756 RepID=A0A328AD43_9CAUL|nr:HAD family hydrolase [Phenylobacterium deserti]RAK52571.1 HAD family hydrolase [Phenylobacterium deserti]
MARAVIFDVDGTLIDTVDLHAAAWVDTFRHFDLDVAYDAVRSQIGKGGDQLMPVFLPPDMLEARGEEIETFRSELFKRDYLPKARGFPQVRDLFQRLKADGVIIAIGSSCKADELPVYTDLADVTDLIDVKTTSDDAERSKPFPDIFQAALEKLAPLTASDVLVVGDSPFDAEAAGRAGLGAVGVLCGGFPEAELRAAGCRAIYADPAAILASYAESELRL